MYVRLFDKSDSHLVTALTLFNCLDKDGSSSNVKLFNAMPTVFKSAALDDLITLVVTSEELDSLN